MIKTLIISLLVGLFVRLWFARKDSIQFPFNEVEKNCKDHGAISELNLIIHLLNNERKKSDGLLFKLMKEGCTLGMIKNYVNHLEDQINESLESNVLELITSDNLKPRGFCHSLFARTVSAIKFTKNNLIISSLKGR